MRKYYLDVANMSMNKQGEELCGDNVEIANTEDGIIVVMSDGLGSGVKANILGTLTSKIAVTMLKEGATIDETIDTIINTLPECQVRKLAYSTFTIVKIKNSGEVYMVEYDNPPVFLFRNNRSCDIKKNRRIVNGKVIFESRFYMNESDALVIISDGVVHAGVGGLLNLGWEWPHINRYLTNVLHKEVIAQNICRQLLEVCKDLYDNKPGDDTTVVTIKIRKEQNISLFTGPPKNKDDDDILINLVKNATGKKIVCGGTTANIISNALHTPIEIDLKHYTSEVPPMGFMKGIDLVTEGILTLNKVKDLLKNYLNSIKKNAIPCAINGSDGASRITNMLINEGTSIDIYIGQAVNPAHQNPSFPDEFNLKIKIVKDISRLLISLGKKVNVNYL
ncbi:SpoIIE family protein phosphatase [Clostridium sp. UBA7503]|uniref:SpoIIE family protein phosphatase n=1 Tax=Clostridium sp. UBA7503 TaxID=1946377 RepID=UPI003217948D